MTAVSAIEAKGVYDPDDGDRNGAMGIGAILLIIGIVLLVLGHVLFGIVLIILGLLLGGFRRGRWY